MGIDGLHSVLKPYLAKSHASQWRGRRLGIDAWAWLHRGAVGAARELALGTRPWEQRGQDPPYVAFCLKLTAMLAAHGATPVLVFDGCRLPAKAGTNAARRQRRSEARQKAQALLAEGRDAEAQGLLMQCIDVTADMAHEVIVRLRQRGVEYVVAPYEADAQLAYLSSLPEREGGVAAVVTEDSDLAAYGCSHVLFKMDSAGHCCELRLERLFEGPEAALSLAASGLGIVDPASLGGAPGSSLCGGSGSAAACSQGGSGSRTQGGAQGGTQGSKKGGKKGGGGGGPFSLKGWTLEMLQAACVLAGCDFLPSLKGVSFRTAAAFVGRGRCLEGALCALRREKRFAALCTDEYCAAAAAAVRAFRHALVFCPRTAGGSLRRLTPLPVAQLGGASGASGGAAEGPGGGAAEAAEVSGNGGTAPPAKAADLPDLSHLGAELDAEVARGIAFGRLHPHTLQPFAAQAPPPPPQQQQQQHRQHQRQHQQQAHQRQRQQHQRHAPLPPQQQPSTAGGQQLKSWLTAAGHHASSVHLPPQHARPPVQHTWQAPHQHQQQHQQQPVQQAPLRNLFSRQQHTAPPTFAAVVAGTARCGGAAPCDAALQPAQQPKQHPTAAPPAAVAAAADPEEDPACSLELCGSLATAGSATWPDQAAGPGPRSPLRPISNQQPQEATQQQQATQQHSCGAPTQRLWDSGEQYRGGSGGSAAAAMQRRAAPAPLAGSKRKSSSGGTGGSAKKGARLAPPSQRISRFFQPAAAAGAKKK